MSFEEMAICEESNYDTFKQISKSTAFINQDTGFCFATEGFYAKFGREQRQRERIVAQRRIKGGLSYEC